VFLRRLSVLVSGTAIAQLVNFAFLPVLTRLYKPEAFADLAVVVVVSLLASLLMTVRYEVAIILPKSMVRSKKIALLSLFIATIIFIALNLVVNFIFHDEWPLKVSVFVAYFLALINIGTNVSIKSGRFGVIAVSKLVQVFVTIALQLFLLFLFGGSESLVYGYAGGLLASAIYISFISRKAYNESLSRQDVISLVSKYKQFPLFNATQAFLNSLSSNLLIFLLKKLFGAFVLGQYSVASRVLQTPMSILSQSIKQVVLKEFSEESKNYDNLLRLFANRTCFAALVSVIPILVFVVFSTEIVVFVLGGEWEVAGTFAKYLALWLYFVFVSSPATAMIQVVNLQGWFLIYEIFLAVTRCLLMLYAYIYTIPEELFIITFSIIGALFNMALIVFVYSILRKMRCSL